MTITFTSILTDGGSAKLADATVSTIPINITNFKIGEDAAITLNPALTDVVGTVVKTGTVGELTFEIVDNNQVLIKVTLDEADGPYDMGNIGLFTDDNTMVTISTFSEQLPKTPNAVGVVGNRYQLTVPIAYVNLDQLINFSLLSPSAASLPWVDAIADLPDPALTTFQAYIVRNEPGVDKAFLAMVNENSGVFSWSTNFNDIHYGESNAQIAAADGNFQVTVNGDLELDVGNADSTLHTRLNIPDGAVSTPALRFINNSDLGIYRNTNNSMAFSAAGLQKAYIDTSGIHIASSSSSMFLRDGSAASPNLRFETDDDTGIYRHGTNEIGFSTGGARQVLIDAAGRLRVNTGSATNPTFAFINDSNTGMFNASGDEIGFASGGQEAVRIDQQGVQALTTTSSSFGLDPNLSAFKATTPGGGSATWLLTHINDDSTFRSGIQSLNGGNNIRIYTGGGAYIDWTDRLKVSTDGTNSSPVYSFENDSNTGIYLPATDQIGFTAGGTLRAKINNNGIEISQDGSASSPTLFWNGDTDTGLYHTSNEISIAAAGTQTLRVNTTSTSVLSGNFYVAADGTAASPAIQVGISDNTGLYYSLTDFKRTLHVSTDDEEAARIDEDGIFLPGGTGGPGRNGRFSWIDQQDKGMWSLGNNQIGFLIAGTNRFSITETTSGFSGTDYFFAPTYRSTNLGSASEPAYRFTSDNDTGMYSPAADELCLATGGVDRFCIDSSGNVTMTGTILFPNGSGTAPSISFTSDPDTGFYRSASNNIGVAMAGALRWEMNSSGIDTIGDDFYIGTATIGDAGVQVSASDDNPTTFRIIGNWDFAAETPNDPRATLEFRGSRDLSGDVLFGRIKGSVENFGASTNDWDTELVFTVWEDTAVVNSSTEKEVLRLRESGLYLTNHATTASGANAFIDSGTDQLMRSTSSRKYKKNIKDFSNSYSEFIYDLRPITYQDKGNDQKADGLIAEEVHKVNSKYVQYAGDDPDGLSYDRLVVPIIAEMKKLKEELTSIKAELEELKGQN